MQSNFNKKHIKASTCGQQSVKTWGSPFTLRSGLSHAQQRQKRLRVALRSRGECGWSWHLIWGASRLGRSSPQLAIFPYPGCAVGLCREEYVCFSMLVCPERSQYAADHSDITHKSSTTGQIKHSASQLELLGDSEREVAVSCWCVCVNPVGTKPPLAPPLSFKLHHSINLRKLECCGNSDKVMPSSKVSQHKWKELNFTQGGWSQECY